MLPTNSQPTGRAQIVLDVLLEGLRITNRNLNEMCRLALLSIGGRAVFRLQAAANDLRTRATHRQRLKEILERIENSPEMDAGVGQHIMNALLDSLRIKNKRLNDKAIAAFGSLHGSSIGTLITQAILNHKRAAGYCARLLKAADAVDGPPDVIQHLGLMELMFSSDETVRQLASDLVWKLRWAGQNQPLDSTP